MLLQIPYWWLHSEKLVNKNLLLFAVSRDESLPGMTPRMMKCITGISISSAVSLSMTTEEKITLLNFPFYDFSLMTADLNIWR